MDTMQPAQRAPSPEPAAGAAAAATTTTVATTPVASRVTQSAYDIADDQVLTFPHFSLTAVEAKRVFQQQLGVQGLTPFALAPSDDEREHLNHYARFTDNRARRDPLFESYNAARVANTNIVLAEGPALADTRFNVTPYQRWLNNTFANPRFPQRVFLAVGKTSRDNPSDPDFVDYFQWGRVLSADAFFEALAHRRNLTWFVRSSDDFEVMRAEANASNFRFYCFAPGVDVQQQNGLIPHDKQTGLVMHIPNWPDHGVVTLSAADKMALLLLALLDPVTATHCRAGRGRSATSIAIRLAVVQKVGCLSSSDEAITAYLEIIQKIRAVKPSAVYVQSQFVMGLQVLSALTVLYQRHQDVSDFLLSCHQFESEEVVDVPATVSAGGAAGATAAAAEASIPAQVSHHDGAQGLQPGDDVIADIFDGIDERVDARRATTVFGKRPLLKGILGQSNLVATQAVVSEGIDPSKASLRDSERQAARNIATYVSTETVKTVARLPAGFQQSFDDDLFLNALDYCQSLLTPMQLVLRAFGADDDGDSAVDKASQQFQFETHYQQALLVMGQLSFKLSQYINSIKTLRSAEHALARYSEIDKTFHLMQAYPHYATFVRNDIVGHGKIETVLAQWRLCLSKQQARVQSKAQALRAEAQVEQPSTAMRMAGVR